MTKKTVKIGAKILKQILTNAAKTVSPTLSTAMGMVYDEIQGGILDIIDKAGYDAAYEQTITGLYPEISDWIFERTEAITATADVYALLADCDFDFAKTADALMKKEAGLSEREKAGLKTGLQYAIGWAYKGMCAPGNTKIYRWMIEQTARNGHETEKLEKNLKAQVTVFSEHLELLGKQVGDHESRIRTLEEKASSEGNTTAAEKKDYSEYYREKWNQPLFLEKTKKKTETQKTLADVYVIPHAVKIGEELLSADTVINEEPGTEMEDLLEGEMLWSNEEEPCIDRYLAENKEPLTLILGQPGSGKSSFIIAYLNGVFGETPANCSVIPFSDYYYSTFWEEQEADVIVHSFLEQIGICAAADMAGRILFLDGFDEINLEKTKRIRFLAELKAFLEDPRAKDGRIFVTCRSNYVSRQALITEQIEGASLQLLDRVQIKDFCGRYGRIQKVKLEKLMEKAEVYGIPILLYMVLATRVYENDRTNTTGIYRKLFTEVYHRSWGNLQKNHRFTSKYADYYNRLAHCIAVYMFEHGDASEGCPGTVIETYAEDLRKQMKIDNRNIPDLIGGFYKAGLTENEHNIYFVHRTIYEYFLSDYLVEILERPDGQVENRFLKDFCNVIRFRQMSDELVDFILENAEDREPDIINVLKKQLEICLEAEQLSDGIPRMLERLEAERYVLANMLKILSKASIRDGCVSWKLNSRKLENYLKLLPQHIDNVSWHLENIDLSNADLAGARLAYAGMFNVNLTGADLTFSDLTGVELVCANLTDANMSDARLKDARMKEAKLIRAELCSAELKYADLESADMREAKLCCADLEGANLSHANLTSADLTMAEYKTALLTDANLTDAKLTEVEDAW